MILFLFCFIACNNKQLNSSMALHSEFNKSYSIEETIAILDSNSNLYGPVCHSIDDCLFEIKIINSEILLK